MPMKVAMECYLGPFVKTANPIEIVQTPCKKYGYCIALMSGHMNNTMQIVRSLLLN